MLYFAEYDLAFFKTRPEMLRHLSKCRLQHPPGDEIYRNITRGIHVSMFEVCYHLQHRPFLFGHSDPAIRLHRMPGSHACLCKAVLPQYISPYCSSANVLGVVDLQGEVVGGRGRREEGLQSKSCRG
jgi:hypothetical protein